MKNKKMLSLALAVAMTATMSMSAFAADKPAAPTTGAGTDVTDPAVITTTGMEVPSAATTVGVTLKIKLPASADVVFNPYSKQDVQEQVLAAVTNIENLSDVDVKLYVNSCTATLDSGANKAIKFATTPVKAGDLTNTIQLFLRTGTDATAIKDNTAVFKAATAILPGDVAVVSQAGTTPPKANPVLIADLEKADASGDAVTEGKVSTQLVGSMSATPTILWSETDTMTIKTLYSARPTVTPATP